MRKVTGATITPSTPANFQTLSAPTTLFTGGPTKSYHTFQVCHDSAIQSVSLGGYTYWAYHTLAGGAPYECHLARSNSLTSGWVDYGKVFDGRWPSVYYDSGGPTFHMFYGRATPNDYVIKRATSSDGITFTYQEDVVSDGNGPFIWKNPNDSQWYLFYHDHNGAGNRVLYKTDASITNLAAATPQVVFNQSAVIAAAAVFYVAPNYQMVTETNDGGAGTWTTLSFRSTSISGAFSEDWNSPILINDDACAIPLLDAGGTTLYLYYAERTSVANDYWNVVVRTATP